MYKVIKAALIALVFQFLFFTSYFSKPVFADVSCQPIYGGGQSCVTTKNFNINKTVLNPQTNQLVNNLSVNDPKYQPGFITTFQITLTNTGNNTISRIIVSDVFPQYVNFSAGPGNFDSNTKTLSFEVNNLNSNETRTFTIIGRVVDSNQIPLDKGVVCVINQAIATNMNNASEVSQDNTQFCIEKVAPTPTPVGFPIFPTAKVKVTPPTGPEAFGLIALIPAGFAGWFLRKTTIKNLKKEGGEK